MGKFIAFYLHLLYDIQEYHYHHRLQYSGWTAHQCVAGHISTIYSEVLLYDAEVLLSSMRAMKPSGVYEMKDYIYPS